MASSPSATVARIVLHSIHLCARVRSIIALSWQWTVWFLSGGLFKHKGTKADLIQEDAKLLDKIPFHLAFVLTEKEHHYFNLVQLVCWAFTSGVQYVSVFDQKGELKRNISRLRQLVNDHYQSMANSLSVVPVHVVCPNDINSTATPTASTDLWLLILSSDDGRGSIVHVAKTLCEEAQHSLLPIDPSTIDNRMAVSGFLPDPDLAIVCGATKSTLGYPPWSSRLTEIMWLSSHYKCSYFEFHSLLQQFADSTQRYGK